MTDYISDTNIVTPTDWEQQKTMIKVIGVGGGGCNAVTYMYRQKIQGCGFVVCNTDSQALLKSDVTVKLQLGNGLGAGTDPDLARKAAIDCQDEILARITEGGTRMLFITAGLGGGTGTGASPVIARLAKENGILTVAVVTLPFRNEGRLALSKAADGIHELERNVDSLLIINNEKLYDYFGDELVQNAFPKADEVLATAVRGIIDIINKPGYINVDFQDVVTMMKNSGMALMGCGWGSGKDRIEKAVTQALESPLLNDFDLSTAKNLLINVTAANNENGLKMQQFGAITDLITERTGLVDKSKRGLIWFDDPNADDTISITVIATGFKKTLTELTGDDLSKLIIIDRDFTYRGREQEAGGEIQLREETYVNKISYNTTENVPHFSYAEKPALVVSSSQEISDLTNKAAISRSMKHSKQAE